MRRSYVHGVTLASLAGAALMIGCTDEKIVYRNATNLPAPPAAAKSFLGYYDASTQQTVCGSCHAAFQGRWSNTKHAVAWEDLQASGHADASCNNCHTTNAFGNASADTDAGFAGTSDARYYDVQCEACHGAGLRHASSPTSSNRPLAAIAVDTGAKNGCGECHSGSHNPFVEEWKMSGHSTTFERSHNSTSAECQGCHTAQGYLLRVGSTENYVEKSGPVQSAVCATCHDPHGSANPAQLRLPLNATTVDGNLCTLCHQRRATWAEVTTRASVHAPEGPTLFGTAGWFPPGMPASGTIVGTHGSPTSNPGLCAGCHVKSFTVNDKAGKFVFQSTGHRFLATPCVDANGQPTVGQTCEETARTFRSCVGSGCHGSENAARTAYDAAEARTVYLVAQANAVIAQVKAGPKTADCKLPAVPNPVPSTCNGLSFNVSLANKAGAAAHNPYLIERLLIAGINKAKADYGVTLAADVDLTPRMLAPQGRVLSTSASVGGR